MKIKIETLSAELKVEAAAASCSFHLDLCLQFLKKEHGNDSFRVTYGSSSMVTRYLIVRVHLGS